MAKTSKIRMRTKPKMNMQRAPFNATQARHQTDKREKTRNGHPSMSRRNPKCAKIATDWGVLILISSFGQTLRTRDFCKNIYKFTHKVSQERLVSVTCRSVEY